MKSILATGGGGPAYDVNLEVFSGVRTFSMMWVIFGHTVQGYILYTRNQLKAYGLAKTWFGIVVLGGPYAVYAFFGVSGFLATYVLEGKVKKAGSCFVAKSYLHRWLRLAPSVGFAILVSYFLMPFLLQGILAPNYIISMKDTCGKYWWTNLLFINNWYPWE